MMLATSTHTSGCGTHLKKSMCWTGGSAATTGQITGSAVEEPQVVVAEEVHRQRHDHVDDHRQDQPEDEHPAEDLVVVLQVHEVRPDDPELQDHHREQQHDQVRGGRALPEV